MAIGDDFSVAVNGDIRHVSGSTHYTVLELHRWLGDLADDAEATGNDYVDISSATPDERSTDQILQLLGTTNIDDDAAEYLDRWIDRMIKKRTSFDVPYITGRGWDIANHISVKLPHQTDDAVIETVIDSFDKNKNDLPKFELSSFWFYIDSAEIKPGLLIELYLPGADKINAFNFAFGQNNKNKIEQIQLSKHRNDFYLIEVEKKNRYVDNR